MKNKHLFSFIMAVIMIFSVCTALPLKISVPLETSAAGIDNIAARADYLYNITWTAQTTVKGWRNNYTFTQGNTYHIPYGQPVSSGKYVYWDIQIDNFLSSTQDASSVFYTKRSVNNYNKGSYSTYYAMDCSALASYCWGLSNRTTTSSWSSLPVTSFGKCTSANVNKIQKGDALNLAGSHIVIVSDVTYDSSENVIQVEITEQTPPETKRSYYTASKLVAKYSNYTIYRYNKRDSVTPPPNIPIIIDNENPSITNTYLSEINQNSFRVVCDANDNIGIGKVEMATWTTADQSDLIWRDAQFNGISSWFVDISRTDYQNNPDVYITHIYVYDTQNNLTTSEIMYWRDIEVPEITNKYISEITDNSFRVVCDATDNDEIAKVKIATWTTADQSDLIWRDAQFNGILSWFVDIPIIDYRDNPEVYISHIYVYDNCGNVSTEEILYYPDYSCPNISDVYFSEISDTSFRIVAKVNDSNGISSVKIATWTTADQSDLIWREAKNNGYGDYFIDIPVSEHSAAPDMFISHIYAYNNKGMLSTKEIIYLYKYNNIKGDINSDGELNIADAVLLQKWLLVESDTELVNWKAADLYEDNRIDIFDMIEMRKLIINSQSAQ